MDVISSVLRGSTFSEFLSKTSPSPPASLIKALCSGKSTARSGMSSFRSPNFLVFSRTFSTARALSLMVASVSSPLAIASRTTGIERFLVGPGISRSSLSFSLTSTTHQGLFLPSVETSYSTIRALPVTHYHAIPAPLSTKYLLQEPFVLIAVNAVDFWKSSHDPPRLRFLASNLEWPQVQFTTYCQ